MTETRTLDDGKAWLLDRMDRGLHPVVPRVDPEVGERHEAVGGGAPRLPWLIRVIRFEPARGKERASLPLAVVTLQGQEPGAPSLVRDSRTLG